MFRTQKSFYRQSQPSNSAGHSVEAISRVAFCEPHRTMVFLFVSIVYEIVLRTVKGLRSRCAFFLTLVPRTAYTTGE